MTPFPTTSISSHRLSVDVPRSPVALGGPQSAGQSLPEPRASAMGQPVREACKGLPRARLAECGSITNGQCPVASVSRQQQRGRRGLRLRSRVRLRQPGRDAATEELLVDGDEVTYVDDAGASHGLAWGAASPPTPRHAATTLVFEGAARRPGGGHGRRGDDATFERADAAGTRTSSGPSHPAGLAGRRMRLRALPDEALSLEDALHPALSRCEATTDARSARQSSVGCSLRYGGPQGFRAVRQRRCP